MNSPVSPAVWFRWLCVFAIELTLIVVAGEVLQRKIRSARKRRLLWQSTLSAVLLLIAVQASGLAYSLPARLRDLYSSSPASSTLQNVPHQRIPRHSAYSNRAQQNRLHAPSLKKDSMQPDHRHPHTVSSQPVPARPSRPARPDSVGYPDVLCAIWLLGTLTLLARALLGRGIILLHLRHNLTQDRAMIAQIQALARQLGFRRSVRVAEWPRLRTPAAFGGWQPTIGLPPGFSTQFTAGQQDAMLVHELAHLIGNDPAWSAFADVLVALLWWHPLLWRAAHQFRVAAELAADEASAILDGGPTALAECLLIFGKRLKPPSSAGALAVSGEGYRSALGRRIERLVHLTGGGRHPSNRKRDWWLRMLWSMALTGSTVLSSGWLEPHSLTKGENPMKTVTLKWKTSVAALALLTGLSSGQPALLGAQSSGEGPHTNSRSLPLAGNLKAKPPELAGTLESSAANAGPPGRAPGVSNSIGSSGRLGPPIVQRKGGQTAIDSIGSPRTTASGVQRSKELLGAGASARNPSPEERALKEKLRAIRLNNVVFDGLPLQQVVQFLTEQALKLDAEHKGVNIVLVSRPPLGETLTSEVERSGRPSTMASPFDINQVIIHIGQPLHDISLYDLLRLLPSTADQPIHCSLEDYGVVIFPVKMPHPPSTSKPEPLVAQTYQVNTNTFFAGLENAFGIEVGNLATVVHNPPYAGMSTEMMNRYGLKPADGSRPKVSTELMKRYGLKPHRGSQPKKALDPMARSRKIHQVIRDWLSQIGVDVGTGDGKRVYYNELTGILMLRATPEDQAIVTAAVKTLGGSPQDPRKQ